VLRRTAAEQDLTQNGEKSPVAPHFSRAVSHHRDADLSNNLYSSVLKTVAAAAHKQAVDGPVKPPVPAAAQLKALYTPQQRLRRDATPWTLVQGILAPLQFAVFLVSASLVLRYLGTGDGLALATASVVLKTLVLYAIMITGSIWEREVFGCYLFAPAFFWEDVFSFLVLALHTAYLVALFAGIGNPRQQMLLALAAYASYFVNATQFLLKLRAARRDERRAGLAAPAPSGGRP
jgi:3-vinyl bacteriochlorophyllide hydratase